MSIINPQNYDSRGDYTFVEYPGLVMELNYAKLAVGNLLTLCFNGQVVLEQPKRLASNLILVAKDILLSNTPSGLPLVEFCTTTPVAAKALLSQHKTATGFHLKDLFREVKSK